MATHVNVGGVNFDTKNQAPIDIGEQSHAFAEPMKPMDIDALKKGAGNPDPNWESQMMGKSTFNSFGSVDADALMNLRSLQEDQDILMTLNAAAQMYNEGYNLLNLNAYDLQVLKMKKNSPQMQALLLI